RGRRGAGGRGKMADSAKGRPAAAPAGKAMTAEQVVARFNRLRQEQRGLASKAAELELELNEHRCELGRGGPPTTGPSPSPGCFPGTPLSSHAPPRFSQISKIIETLNQQLQAKGRELNDFREKHNIRLVGEDDPRQPPKEGAEGAGAKGSSAGVLVS
ncbi:UNVERIFIED_CONTAM: Prefoldin subunit 2, partial [Eudyptes robustus]